MDCIEIGPCQLWHGNALEVLPIINEPIDALICDPPYSSGGLFRGDRAAVPSKKYQSNENAGIYPEFSGDNRDQRSYAYWSVLWMQQCHRMMREGALALVFTDWRQLPTTTDSFQAAGFVWRGLIPWDKTESSRPRDGGYRGQCEYLVWGSVGPITPTGIFGPGIVRHAVTSEPKLHIAGKPSRVFEDVIKPCGATILDPFLGSGPCALAAMRTGRRYIGIEISRPVFDTAVARLEREQAQLDLLGPPPIARPAPAPTAFDFDLEEAAA